jgi:nucleoid-associated protein
MPDPIRVAPLIFSRIHQFLPASSAEAIVVNTALPGSNEDEIHEGLFDALRAAFHGSTRRQHGMFDPESATAALQTGIAEYQGGLLTAENLGNRLAEAFKRGFPDGGLPHPWYLWLIVDQSGETEFVYLFLLKHEESYHLSPQHTAMLDGAIRLDRLHYAVKVNLADWKERPDTCVTYLAPKNQSPVTLAWKALTGFAENAGQAEKTEALLTAVDRYTDKLPEEKEHEYRAKVADYCLEQDRRGAPVEIRELSRHVDEEAPEALLDFLAQHIEEAAGPLYTDRKQLKRYTRLFGRDNDLSIGFSTQMLGNHIIYDERAGTLTIRSIPQSLKSQLARHVKKSG